jgi:nucleoside-diphosphate-sugar epimerase
VRALLAGHGYLGEKIAQALTEAGYDLKILRRRATRGGRFVSADLAAGIPRIEPEDYDVAVFCLAPGKRDMRAYEATYVSAQRNFLAAHRSRYYVYISSTAVYGDAAGTYEEKDGSAHSDKARVLLAAEQIAASHPRSVILRLAGLYSRERPIYGGAAAEFKEDKLVHFIHRDDAARAVSHAIDRAITGVYNVHDGKPQWRSSILRSLGARVNLPGKAAGRLIRHEKFFSTGFNPTYADYFAGTETNHRRG